MAVFYRGGPDDVDSISSVMDSAPSARKEKSGLEHESSYSNLIVRTESVDGNVDVGEEGGLRAWLTVLGSSLVYFASFGIISSWGFFQDYYSTHFLQTAPASTVAFVGTIEITLMNVLAAPAGSLYDWYGATGLYIFSGIGCSGALVILSFVKSGVLWQIFLIQGVLLGIAIAFGAQPALVIVGHHFVRRRALVMGIVAASGSVGGVCFPLILAQLAKPDAIGYQWSLRVMAIIVALCYSIALFISSTKAPAESEKSLRTLFDFKGFLDLRYSVLAVGAFIAMLGQFLPYYYINSYVGASSPVQNYILPLMNASSFVGRILGGVAADKAGPGNTVYPMTILSGVLCLGTWAVTSATPVLILFVILYGFCSGVFVAVLPAIVAQISPVANLGARIGAFYSVCAIAQLVGSPIGGALIGATKGGGGSNGATDGDREASYLGLILFAGITMLAGGIIILISRLLHDRNLHARY